MNGPLGEAIFEKLNNATVANAIEASREISLFLDSLHNDYNLAYLNNRRVDYHYPIDKLHNSFPFPLLNQVNHCWFDHYFDPAKRQFILNSALQGDFNTTETEMMNGLDFISSKDGYGGPLNWQSLFWAVDNGYIHFVEYILNRNVEKNPADHKGDTPLHMAIKRDHFHIFKYIVEKVENKNPANNKGNTPLHEATRLGNHQVVKYLVDRIDEKNPANLKGQLISKANCQAEESPKKRTNEFVFTTVRRVFVRFLGDSSA